MRPRVPFFLVMAALGLSLGCSASDPAPWDLRDVKDSSSVRVLTESPSACRDCIHLEQLVVMGDIAGPGYLGWTRSVTRDSVGNYWVGYRDALKVSDAAGNFVRQVGRVGGGPMEFGRPKPSHTDADGRVHVLDSDLAARCVSAPSVV